METWRKSDSFIKRSIAYYGYMMFGAFFVWVAILFVCFCFGFAMGLMGV